MFKDGSGEWKMYTTRSGKVSGLVPYKDFLVAKLSPYFPEVIPGDAFRPLKNNEVAAYPKCKKGGNSIIGKCLKSDFHLGKDLKFEVSHSKCMLCLFKGHSLAETELVLHI